MTSAPTNLNYEQFGGRLVPFFGDYITVAAQGSTVGAVWTDQRNTVGAANPWATMTGRMCRATQRRVAPAPARLAPASMVPAASIKTSTGQQSLRSSGFATHPNLQAYSR